MADEQEHQEWCDEHDDKQGCATDWQGAVDEEHGSTILTRVLQRAGQAPVVQVAVQVDDQELVADFSPYGSRHTRIGTFPDTLGGAADLAWEARQAFDRQQG